MNLKQLIAGIIVCVLIACSGENERMLCKTWHVSDVIFDLKGKQLDKEQEIAIALMKEMLTKNIYTFNPDGTYMTRNALAGAEGKWKLSGDEIVFTDENNNNQSKRFPILTLTNDTLIISMENDQTSIPITLVLTQVNTQQ